MLLFGMPGRKTPLYDATELGQREIETGSLRPFIKRLQFYVRSSVSVLQESPKVLIQICSTSKTCLQEVRAGTFFGRIKRNKRLRSKRLERTR